MGINFKILFTLALLFNLSNLYAAGKAAQYVDEDNVNNNKSKQIIGKTEPVIIYPGNVLLEARIDTGANTTSLDAQNLQIINEDGVDWAIFSLNGELVKHKIIKFVRIKQHGSESLRRPVIKLKVTLGDITQVVKVTLTNRSNFKYRMLIGINFLYDHFVVDVSQNDITKPSKAVQP
ncbi:Uncharacterized conserved protein [Epsilonproteobacteria bacterium SCGC AD-308-O04]|nr:Uncharacterized conserved protein [Epsilonproteobacteria bacterium SCGC AD-308-O04]